SGLPTMHKPWVASAIVREVCRDGLEQARRHKPVVEAVACSRDMGKVKRPIVLHGIAGVEMGSLVGKAEVLGHSGWKRQGLLALSRRDMRDRQIRHPDNDAVGERRFGDLTKIDNDTR